MGSENSSALSKPQNISVYSLYEFLTNTENGSPKQKLVSDLFLMVNDSEQLLKVSQWESLIKMLDSLAITGDHFRTIGIISLASWLNSCSAEAKN